MLCSGVSTRIVRASVPNPHVQGIQGRWRCGAETEGPAQSFALAQSVSAFVGVETPTLRGPVWEVPSLHQRYYTLFVLRCMWMHFTHKPLCIWICNLSERVVAIRLVASCLIVQVIWVLLGLLSDHVFRDQDLVYKLVILQDDNQLKHTRIAVAQNKQIGSNAMGSWLSESTQVLVFLRRRSRSQLQFILVALLALLDCIDLRIYVLAKQLWKCCFITSMWISILAGVTFKAHHKTHFTL